MAALQMKANDITHQVALRRVDEHLNSRGDTFGTCDVSDQPSNSSVTNHMLCNVNMLWYWSNPNNKILEVKLLVLGDEYDSGSLYFEMYHDESCQEANGVVVSNADYVFYYHLKTHGLSIIPMASLREVVTSIGEPIWARNQYADRVALGMLLSTDAVARIPRVQQLTI